MPKKLMLYFCIIFIPVITKAQISDTLIVYPNPFQDTAIIEFQINQSDTISLNVFNTVGVNVRPYFHDSIFPAGAYSTALIGNGLTSGVYFIKLKINDAILTKIVVKNNGATSLNENESFINKFLFYPNPANEILNINYTLVRNSKTLFQLINAVGQIVKEVTNIQPLGNYNLIIDTKPFAKGIYYMRITSKPHLRQARKRYQKPVDAST